MTTLRETSPDLPAHPLDLVEDIVIANEWPFDRASDDELVAELRGRCCDYRLFFVWRDDVSALHFSCAFDAKVPETRRREIYTLIGMINERLWIGHIEIGQEDGMPLFRHTLPLRGLLTGASLEQIEDLVDAAFTECERFFPAFQLVIWGGKSAAEALEVALFETLGEA